MQNDTEKKHNADLIAAVRYLKAKGLIEKDKDIAEDIDYNKGSISSFLSGTIKASKPFRKLFEEKYQLSLDQFANEKSEPELGVAINISLQEYIDELRNDKKQLQEIVKLNLTAIVTMLTSLSRHDQVYHETMLRSLARLEKRNESDLVLEAGTKEAAQFVKENQMDKAKQSM